MSCEYMFSCYLFQFILLFSTSTMFELHVVVAAVIMSNILELLLEVLPNFPTHSDDSAAPDRRPSYEQELCKAGAVKDY
jgi:hypothetical protein